MRHVSVQLIEMVRAECFDATTLLQCGRRPFALDDDCARAVEEGGVCIHDGQKVMAQRFRPVDYSHEASFHLFAQEFFGQRISYPNLRLFRLPNGREIEVLGINSVRLRHERDRNFGYVQGQLYEDALRASIHDPEKIRIAVLHHHLVAAPREESLDPEWPEASISATLDAGAVIDGLQSHGFGLVLNGHQHVPSASRIARGNKRGGVNDLANLGGLVVLSAGSAGSTRLTDELRENSYNVIELNGGTFDAEARSYNPGRAPQTVCEENGGPIAKSCFEA
jgi:hypothetical protein